MIQLVLAICVIGLLIWIMGVISAKPIDMLGFGLYGTRGLIIYFAIHREHRGGDLARRSRHRPRVGLDAADPISRAADSVRRQDGGKTLPCPIRLDVLYYGRIGHGNPPRGANEPAEHEPCVLHRSHRRRSTNRSPQGTSLHESFATPDAFPGISWTRWPSANRAEGFRKRWRICRGSIKTKPERRPPC